MFQILNTFIFLFISKILVIRAGSDKILVRIANREDPNQTSSAEAVLSGSVLFVLVYLTATSVQNLRTSTVSNNSSFQIYNMPFDWLKTIWAST